MTVTAIDPKYVTLSPDVKYIGVDDLTLELFENQYPTPQGMSYNSYLILDEKICVMDTTDPRTIEQWEANLQNALEGRTPDYVVALHVEPDHSSALSKLLAKYPECKLVCSAKALQFLSQFDEFDYVPRTQTIKDGDTLLLGRHSLRFFSAPMVHWPEVMMAYEAEDKILFSADAFGKFGALQNETDDWACEARRYYVNICGKYGAPVQSALKKAKEYEIKIIAPLHGPVLKVNLDYYMGLYDTWSRYEPETRGVFIAHCSLHGNTSKAAKLLAQELEKQGVEVAINDLCHDDQSEGVEDAFKYDKMVLCSPTYDAGLMPKMEDFLSHLKSKGLRKRTVALVENGTWAPVAAKLMRARLEEMPGMKVLDQQVTIKSALKKDTEEQLRNLAVDLSKI